MELNFENPATRKALKIFTERGRKARCPFCIGRMIASVSRGDRIIMLKGMHVGQEALVVDQRGLSDDEFLVRFAYQSPDDSYRIHYKRDQFTHSPIKTIPDWLCNLSVDDLCAIDNAALMMNLILAENGPPICSADVLLPIISTVRSRRLPISGTELWPTLQRHGMSEKLKDEFCHCFDFGNELLVSLTWSAGH